MAEVILTKENFEKEVKESQLPCLVDFWATWCGPCKMMAPIVEELSKDFEGKVKVCKLNIDDEPEMAISYGVMSIPTFIVFENGEVKTKAIGYREKGDLIDALGLK